MVVMKVLYIGHYKENSGYGQASRDYIKSLSTIKEIDLVTRPIIFSGGNLESFRHLEDKELTNVDVCIQHVLPHYMVPSEKFKKNIGLFVSETDINFQSWNVIFEHMDELWIPNNTILKRFSNKVTGPKFKIVPHACDIEKYKKKYPKIHVKELESTFKFYFIGEFNRRKNITTLLECFHTEFQNYEPVSLIIKTSIPGVHPKESIKIVSNFLSRLKQNLKLYKNESSYIKELAITDNLSDEQICGLHQYCDCYIQSSFGEAWGIPAFDAMGFNNTPICTAEGGALEYIDKTDKTTGVLVSAQEDIVAGVDSAVDGIFTAREKWQSINKIELRKAMRHMYNINISRDKRNGFERANDFSYENVGKIIKKALFDE